MSGATRVSDLEIAEHLGYDAGKGVKRVSVFNDGVQANLATEETLQSIAGMNIPKNDEIQATYPTTSSEVYTYKYQGTTVGTITVTFTDNTKAVLTSVILS